MLDDLVGYPAVPEVEPAAEEEQKTAEQKEDEKSVSHGPRRDESGDDQKTAGEQENSAQKHLLDVLKQFQ